MLINLKEEILHPSQIVCRFREKICPNLYVALQYECNINVIFPIITSTINDSLLSILSFIFPILFIKDNFVKQLIISLFDTILIAFLNMCEMPKTSYYLGWRTQILCIQFVKILKNKYNARISINYFYI